MYFILYHQIKFVKIFLKEFQGTGTSQIVLANAKQDSKNKHGRFSIGNKKPPPFLMRERIINHKQTKSQNKENNVMNITTTKITNRVVLLNSSVSSS